MKGITVLGCLIVVAIFLIINSTIGYFCTDYVFEFYGSKIAKKPIEVSFSISLVSGLFIGEITIPLAIITYGVIARIW